MRPDLLNRRSCMGMFQEQEEACEAEEGRKTKET